MAVMKVKNKDAEAIEKGLSLIRSIAKKRYFASNIQRDIENRYVSIIHSGSSPRLSFNSDCIKANEHYKVWVACIIFVAIALHQNQRRSKRNMKTAGINPGDFADNPFGEGRLYLSDLLEDSGVRFQELFENLESAMKLSAVPVLRPCASRSAALSMGVDFSNSGNVGIGGRRLTPDGEVKLFNSEQRVLRDVGELRLSLISMSILLQKLSLLWECADQALSLTNVSNDPTLMIEATWLMFAIVIRLLQPEADDDEKEDGDIFLAWAYKLLVSVVYLVRFPSLNDSVLSGTDEVIEADVKRRGSGRAMYAAKRARHVAKRKRNRNEGDAEIDGVDSDDDESVRLELEHRKKSILGFFEESRVSKEDVLEKASIVEKCFASRGAEGIVEPNFRLSKMRDKSDEQILMISAAASKYYQVKYLSSITQFDPRCLLGRAAGLESTHTPIKHFADLKITNGSLEHKRSKEHYMDTNRNRLKEVSNPKTLFVSETQSPTLPAIPGMTSIENTPPMQPSCCYEKHSIPKFSLDSSAKPFATPDRTSKRFAKTRHMYTPVSGALDASNWLSRELDESPVCASETLERFFQECDVNPAKAIDTRLEAMCQSLRRTHRSRRQSVNTVLFTEEKGQKHLASSDIPRSPRAGMESHMIFGRKLYFRVLELIMIGESSRLGTRKFDALLCSNMFHRALFAVCMQVVYRWKEAFRYMYPSLITCLDVSAFEVMKVIETFVTYVPTLPRLLKQHLHAVETHILEQGAWTAGSPVFRLLQQYSGSSQGQTDPSTSAEMRSLGVFLEKVQSVAFNSLKKLYSGLNLPLAGSHCIDEDIWELFKRALVEYPTIFKNRHIDSVLLCCVFAIVKVSKFPLHAVTFTNLLQIYKVIKQPVDTQESYIELITQVKRGGIGGDAELLKCIAYEIVLDDNGNTGDLVKYYNAVFLPVMKEAITSLHSEGQSTVKMSSTTMSCPNAISVPSTPQASRSTNDKIYPSSVNSATQSAQRVHMTPRTSRLWAFRDSPPLQNRVISVLSSHVAMSPQTDSGYEADRSRRDV